MPKGWLLAALMSCLSPAAATAQLSLLVGGHVATRVGDGNINNWRAGGQIALASDYLAFSLAGNVIFAYSHEDPVIELDGWNAIVATRVTPFRKFWYLGWGIRIHRETTRVVRPFHTTEILDSDFGGVSFTGLWYPFGRLRPFAEIQIVDLLGGSPNETSYVFGLDLKFN